MYLFLESSSICVQCAHNVLYMAEWWHFEGIKFKLCSWISSCSRNNGTYVFRLWSRRWRTDCRSIKYRVCRYSIQMSSRFWPIQEFATALCFWIFCHSNSHILSVLWFVPCLDWWLQFLVKQHKYWARVLLNLIPTSVRKIVIGAWRGTIHV